MEDNKGIQNEYEISNISNEHTIMHKLKEFIYKTQTINDFKNIDIIISEVKDFIYRVPILKKEYENRLLKFNEFNSKHKYIKYAVKKFLYNIINKEHELFSNTNSGVTICFQVCEDMPIIYFYSSLRYIMGNPNEDIHKKESINYDFGILNFYNKNMRNYYFDIEKQKTYFSLNELQHRCINSKNLKALIDTLDFNALDFEIYKSSLSHLYNDLFFQKWLHSALLGVLYSLQNYLKGKLQTNSVVKIYIQKKDIINRILKSKNKDIILKILASIIKNEDITVINLMNENTYSESTIKRILNEFNFLCTGEAKGELGTAKLLIKQYSFNIEDLNPFMNRGL